MAKLPRPPKSRQPIRQAVTRLARRLTLEEVPLDQLELPERSARVHSDRQRVALAASINERGFVCPILATRDGGVIDGRMRVEVAREVGMTAVPVVYVDNVNRAERRLLSIAINRIPDLSKWDNGILALEFGELLQAIDLDFNVEATGFTTGELDVIFEASIVNPSEESLDDDVERPAADQVVSRLDDLWLIDRDHRLLCANARSLDNYRRLFDQGDQARMVITDHPFNVKIRGHVSGLGKVRHREFIEASGEMSKAGFIEFLTQTILAMSSVCVDGAILFTAMDWRHIAEMMEGGTASGLNLINLCVWKKCQGGMGSLYRSQHELYFVWKKGDASHVNNVQLGAQGRYRTNVWSVPGQNSFGANRDEELALHPTVKPVTLIAEAIRDVSHHGEIVLDPFCGSGTTLIAAEKTQRRAYAMELDPAYVDVALRRFQKFRPDTRIVLALTGETFAEVEARRAAAGDFDPEPSLPDSAWDIL